MREQLIAQHGDLGVAVRDALLMGRNAIPIRLQFLLTRRQFFVPGTDDAISRFQGFLEGRAGCAQVFDLGIAVLRGFCGAQQLVVHQLQLAIEGVELFVTGCSAQGDGR